jgi:hypothetical protein
MENKKLQEKAEISISPSGGQGVGAGQGVRVLFIDRDGTLIK